MRSFCCHPPRTIANLLPRSLACFNHSTGIHVTRNDAYKTTAPENTWGLGETRATQGPVPLQAPHTRLYYFFLRFLLGRFDERFLGLPVLRTPSYWRDVGEGKARI